MYGLFVALGSAARYLTKEDILKSWKEIGASNIRFFNLDKEISVALFTPIITPPKDNICWTQDKKVGIAIDGYLITESLNTEAMSLGHLMQLSGLIHKQGILEGLRSIISGSFNLVIIDAGKGIFSIANDRLGSIPLYYAEIDDGCILSTNPVALASTGLIPRNIDYTACAEWAYIGYTIGDRYFLKEIKIFPPASILH